MSLSDKARHQLQVISRDVRDRVGLPAVAARPRVLLDAIPFQTDLDEIIEEPAPQLLRATAALVGILLLAVTLVTSIVKMDIVVVAVGHLAADGPTIVLQPMERAIIRELRVRPGDVVHKGQVLATLDPTFSEADLDTLLVQQHDLSATARRLDAELEGHPLAMARPIDATEVLQYQLYAERTLQYGARTNGFDEEIARDEAAARTTEEDVSQLARQLVVARSVLTTRSALLASQAGSKLQYYDAEGAAMRAEREYTDSMNHLEELRHAVAAKRADRQAFVNQWRSDLLEQTSRDKDELAKLGDAIAKASRMHDMVVLTAPDDGVILDVAMRSAGSVLREAEPLITELPSGAALIADVAVASEDIGSLKPGLTAVVKVAAFPFQRYGMLRGALRSVGEEPLGSEAAIGMSSPRAGSTGGQHRVLVELTDLHLSHLPDGAHLIPGMTVTAELKVGSRRVIAYFLDPVTQGLNDSFHEE